MSAAGPHARNSNVTPECDNLDAFLLGELSPRDVERFDLHVRACEECREAIEQQRWIDNLLCSDAAAEAEQAPLALRDSLRALPIRRGRNVSLIACGMAAAAALLIAVGWTALRSGPTDNVQDQAANVTVNPEISPAVVTPAVAKDSIRPRATFVSGGDTIAVPMESADDDVTIVQLYPTTQTERRLQRELALQVTLLDSNGG
jgi:putative zinc finger protein